MIKELSKFGLTIVGTVPGHKVSHTRYSVSSLYV